MAIFNIFKIGVCFFQWCIDQTFVTLVCVWIVCAAQIEDHWRSRALDSDFASQGCTATFFYAQKLLLITKG